MHFLQPMFNGNPSLKFLIVYHQTGLALLRLFVCVRDVKQWLFQRRQDNGFTERETWDWSAEGTGIGKKRPGQKRPKPKQAKPFPLRLQKP